MKMPRLLAVIAMVSCLKAHGQNKENTAPPEPWREHQRWTAAASSLPERISRLESFRDKYLSNEEGGKNNSIGYEDASHTYAIVNNAWALAKAYIEAGEKDKALKMLEWLNTYDSKADLLPKPSPRPTKPKQ